MKLSLQGSRAAFVEREMVLVLADGSAYQVKLEMDGRAVGAIVVQERMSVLPPPASISVLKNALFVGCAEGDSVLYSVDLVRDSAKAEEVKPDLEMDAEDDGEQFHPDRHSAWSITRKRATPAYKIRPVRRRQSSTIQRTRPHGTCSSRARRQ